MYIFIATIKFELRINFLNFPYLVRERRGRHKLFEY